MKGTSTDTKLVMCREWLEQSRFSWASKVQVMNYINALKRGGQLGMDVSKELRYLGLDN